MQQSSLMRWWDITAYGNMENFIPGTESKGFVQGVVLGTDLHGESK